MGTAERRERERAELRTKILDAARELFLAEGYDAVTLRKVAEKIEYSPTAIYIYFRDKETLVREVCLTDFLTLAEDLQKIARITDPIERIRRAGHVYVRFAVEHPNHYKLMFMTPPPVPHGDEPWKGNPEFDAYAFLAVAVREAIEQGFIRSDLKDADLVAQTIWAAMHGLVALEITRSADNWIEWRPIKKRVELMIAMVTRGLAKEES